MNKVYAAITNPALPSGNAQNPLGFGSLVSVAINIIYVIGGVALTVYLVYGGLMYITSSGDDKNLSKAKRILTDAIIGIAIVVASVPLAKLIGSVFGINLFNINFPTI